MNSKEWPWGYINIALIGFSAISGWISALSEGRVIVPFWVGFILLVASFGGIIGYFSIRGYDDIPRHSLSLPPFSIGKITLNLYYIGGLSLIALGGVELIVSLFIGSPHWKNAFPSICMGTGAILAVGFLARRRGRR